MSYFTDNWVKTNANDNDDDLFSMHFDYTTSNANTNATAQFNGNISQVTWRVRGDDNKSSYGFQYDNLNRLTDAKYAQYDDNSVYTNIDDYSVSNISYDLNGNMKTLNRMGFDGSGFSQIDQMSYTYENNSNILAAVSDAAKDDYGFKEDNQSSTDYVYDDNGNMTKDYNKGIEITYNHLNLPKKVEWLDANHQKTGKYISWLYDAAGVKLKKFTDDNQGNTSEKNYVGGIEYIKEGSSYKVEAIYHSEGRIVPMDVDGKYQHEYTLKDHLGNSRVTFADLDGDAIVDETEILETNHYYPFGMRHEPSSTTTGSANAYTYNGKELNAEFGLDWLDYGARWYDASIARWSAVDPHAENYYPISPYVYVANNPLIFIDPDGRDIIITWDEDGETKTLTYSYEKDRVIEEGTSDFVTNTLMALDDLYSTGASDVTFEEGEDTEAIDILDAFMESDEHNLTIVEGTSNKYNPNTNTISFNHTKGVRFRKDLSKGWTEDNTGRNSASALLGHEIIHGYNDEFDHENYVERKSERYENWRTEAPHFPNKEEKEVTTNWANQINERLGQDKRTHYMRSYYPTENPTSTKEKKDDE
jgi:RHS repeat-associated protein